jgi:heme/copper-type cytochrome/quinol oxidase subunit 2
LIVNSNILSEAFANVISGAVALNVYTFHCVVVTVAHVTFVVAVLNVQAVTSSHNNPSITSAISHILAITLTLTVVSFSIFKFMSFIAITAFHQVTVISSNVASISSSFSTLTNFNLLFSKLPSSVHEAINDPL